jgi:hypothetical protein
MAALWGAATLLQASLGGHALTKLDERHRIGKTQAARVKSGWLWIAARRARAMENQISLTDVDSRAMARTRTWRSATTSRSPRTQNTTPIVEQQVTNQVIDMGLPTETAEPDKQILVRERIAVMADQAIQNRGHRGLRKAEMEP